MPPRTVAAIAAACPRLRSLTFLPESAEAIAALKQLRELEEVVVGTHSNCDDDLVLPGVVALSQGPAARSLRRIRYGFGPPFEFNAEFFPKPFPKNLYWFDPDVPLDDELAAALSRMPRLEFIGPLKIYDSSVSSSAIEALGRLPCLREGDFEYFASGSGHFTPQDFSSSISRLSKLNLSIAGVLKEEDLLALLAACRPALRELRLALGWPLGVPEARALVELPALRFLSLDCPIQAAPGAPAASAVEPYLILQGLRRGVRVTLKRDRGDCRMSESLMGRKTEAERAVFAMFKDRRGGSSS
eukprot:tig00021257_g19745.t1